MDREVIDALRAGGGVIAARGDAVLARRLQRHANSGTLCRVAPGLYVAPTSAADPLVRIVAATHWAPGAVLTGAAAARLTFWPEVAVDTVTLSGPVAKVAVGGMQLVRERVPPELIMTVPGPGKHLPVTMPALTALDLGADGIDRVLLTRAASLADLHRALELTPNRPGNVMRRKLLYDSRDEPWSAAERLGHAVLRSGAITGWRTNVEVRCPSAVYFVDVAWARLKLAIEIDGYAYHSDRDQFERDRRKWSDLTAQGWRVVHLTWSQLTDDREWVLQTVRWALSQI